MLIQHHKDAKENEFEANRMTAKSSGNPILINKYLLKLGASESRSFLMQIQQYKLCAMQEFQNTVASAKSCNDIVHNDNDDNDNIINNDV